MRLLQFVGLVVGVVFGLWILGRFDASPVRKAKAATAREGQRWAGGRWETEVREIEVRGCVYVVATARSGSGAGAGLAIIHAPRCANHPGR